MHCIHGSPGSAPMRPFIASAGNCPIPPAVMPAGPLSSSISSIIRTLRGYGISALDAPVVSARAQQAQRRKDTQRDARRVAYEFACLPCLPMAMSCRTMAMSYHGHGRVLTARLTRSAPGLPALVLAGGDIGHVGATGSETRGYKVRCARERLAEWQNAAVSSLFGA